MYPNIEKECEAHINDIKKVYEVLITARTEKEMAILVNETINLFEDTLMKMEDVQNGLEKNESFIKYLNNFNDESLFNIEGLFKFAHTADKHIEEKVFLNFFVKLFTIRFDIENKKAQDNLNKIKGLLDSL